MTTEVRTIQPTPPATPDPAILPLLLWLLPVLAAGLLLWLWPNRRVPCPPSCRRCGYNVSGRAAGSDRCSECGADLTGRTAVVTVRRSRGRATTAVLLGLLVASGGWLVHRALPFEWARWYLARAPDAWVAAHAERGRGPLADQALGQWLDRYRGGRLAAAGADRLHEHLLARQADATRPWDRSHGDLLYAALVARKLSPAQAGRFVRGTFPGMAFQVRPAVRAGDPVPFTFAAGFRGGNPVSWATAIGATASFAGPPKVPAGDAPGWRWGGFGGGPWTEVAGPAEAGTRGLAPGVHRLHLVLAVALTADPVGDTHLHPVVEYRDAVEVEVLPAGAAVGTPVPDAANAHAVARAVRAALFREDGGQIVARVALDPAPVDRAFEIWVEHAGRRHRVGRRYAAAGAGSYFQFDADDVPVKDAPGVGPMTLVLVGSGEGLVEAPTQQAYWAGTITFPDLPIRPRGEAYDNSVPPPPYRVTPGPGPATGLGPATVPGPTTSRSTRPAG